MPVLADETFYLFQISIIIFSNADIHLPLLFLAISDLMILLLQLADKCSMRNHGQVSQ